MLLVFFNNIFQFVYRRIARYRRIIVYEVENERKKSYAMSIVCKVNQSASAYGRISVVVQLLISYSFVRAR